MAKKAKKRKKTVKKTSAAKWGFKKGTKTPKKKPGPKKHR